MDETVNDGDERYWLLVSLVITGEANEAERNELASIIQEHPERAGQLQLFASLWQSNQASKKLF